jgi:PBP1b-binding outer membrane lipoprotein LpoB
MKQVLAGLAVLLAACSADEPPPPEKQEPQGRAETQSIRNTDAVGYSGSAIADKVDAGLDKNEEAAKKRQEEADRAGE